MLKKVSLNLFFLAHFLIGQNSNAQVITELFGSGTNQITIDLVRIDNPGNAADDTGYGSVNYIYNIGKYEISRDQINKANLQGGLGISLFDMSSYGGNSNLSRPASGITWYEAARFVNWLNTSKGNAPAYKFDGNGSFQVWTSTDNGFDSSNPYRNSLAKYWIPNSNEWYKSAFGSPSGAWFDFADGSNATPNPVSSGTGLLDIVYAQATSVGPADVTNAGGLSPYGTMAQSGNVWEWTESAFDGVNNDPSESRERRGGSWYSSSATLGTLQRHTYDPSLSEPNIGFRIASVPEPSALSLLAIGLGGLAMMRRRRS